VARAADPGSYTEVSEATTRARRPSQLLLSTLQAVCVCVTYA